MNYIVTEKQLRILTENINLLTEQSQSIVPELAIDAISKIESIYGHMENGKVVGYPYTGREKLSVMENYIKDTIGFDCWNSLSDKFKSQIYGFCFQADTDVPYKFKFIAGLANAIDSSVDRSKIVGKTINNNNVKNAILLIKNNCNRLNSFYDSYLKIVDQQYKSMDYNDNYKFIWKYRPTAIDRILSGEDVSKVLTDWKESFNSVTADTKKTQSGPTNTLQDYEGTYTFVSENGEKTTGNIKEENGKLRVSRGNDYFYLTKTQGEQFEGETKASNEQDKRIPKILGYITIEITAIFNRNNNKQVCSVDGTAKWGIKKEKIIATKDGVSCADTSVQKPITTTSVSTQKPVDTPVQKPINTTSVSTTSSQTNKTGTSKRQIKDLNIISPEKYSVRIRENYNMISEDIESTNQKKSSRIYDAILVGGLDYRMEEVKTKDGKIKKVLIDKTIDEQLAIFQQGFGGGKVKAFRYNVPFETIMTYLKSSPKIPIFLFSAGCNFADELITSELVDKNKIYIIEPFNKGGRLNKSVSNAISNGLNPRNIFVKKGSPGRGYGFSGASDSGASSHWDALRTVPKKVKF